MVKQHKNSISNKSAGGRVLFAQSCRTENALLLYTVEALLITIDIHVRTCISRRYNIYGTTVSIAVNGGG